MLVGMAMPAEAPSRRSNLWPLKTVGAAAVLFALLGLWHSAATLAQEAAGRFAPADEVLFRRILYPLTWCCVAGYIWQAEMGLRFLRGEKGALLRFTGLLVGQTLFFFGLHAACLLPALRGDAAAAAGLATGGLLFQLLLLFPVWGPILANRGGKPVV